MATWMGKKSASIPCPRLHNTDIATAYGTLPHQSPAPASSYPYIEPLGARRPRPASSLLRPLRRHLPTSASPQQSGQTPALGRPPYQSSRSLSDPALALESRVHSSSPIESPLRPAPSRHTAPNQTLPPHLEEPDQPHHLASPRAPLVLLGSTALGPRRPSSRSHGLQARPDRIRERALGSGHTTPSTRMAR